MNLEMVDGGARSEEEEQALQQEIDAQRQKAVENNLQVLANDLRQEDLQTLKSWIERIDFDKLQIDPARFNEIADATATVRIDSTEQADENAEPFLLNSAMLRNNYVANLLYEIRNGDISKADALARLDEMMGSANQSEELPKAA